MTWSRLCAQRPAATHTTVPSQTLSGRSQHKSEEFRTRWAAHNVRFHNTGVKRIQHRVARKVAARPYRWDAAPYFCAASLFVC